MLKVNNLEKRFAIEKSFLGGKKSEFKAVSNVNFSVGEGETFSIVGESGSGKSTLGKMIVGLLKPEEGEIFFNGKNIIDASKEEMKAIREGCQIIFQDPYASLNPKMTIGQLIQEPLKIHKKGDKDFRKQKSEQLIEMVGLKKEDLDKYPHEFSGGQRQRICIARALALEPKVIVCDEAVSALDVLLQTQIINLLKEMQQKYKLTYIFISHDLAVVRHISTRIGVMYAGEMVEYGETEQIFQNPLHPYTKMLISSIPAVNPALVKEHETKENRMQNKIGESCDCKFSNRCTECTEICQQFEKKYFEVEDNHFVMCHKFAYGKEG